MQRDLLLHACWLPIVEPLPHCVVSSLHTIGDPHWQELWAAPQYMCKCQECRTHCLFIYATTMLLFILTNTWPCLLDKEHALWNWLRNWEPPMSTQSNANSPWMGENGVFHECGFHQAFHKDWQKLYFKHFSFGSYVAISLRISVQGLLSFSATLLYKSCRSTLNWGGPSVLLPSLASTLQLYSLWRVGERLYINLILIRKANRPVFNSGMVSSPE